MKYLIITGVFVLGLSLGYIIGIQKNQSAGNDNQNLLGLLDSSTESTEHGRENKDHSVEHENQNSEKKDTAGSLTDSLITDLLLADSLSSEEHISTEKMIRSIQFPIVYLEEEETGDTTMAELLGIENVQSTSMFVEFWESPLNFEGYKLSKKKLIVYGLSPQFDYKLYKEGNDYYFSYQNVYYKMKETQDFLPFTEVARSEVFND